MPMRPLFLLSLALAATAAMAQTAPPSNPASAPSPKPIAMPAPATPSPGVPQDLDTGAVARSNPAAAPVQPHSDAGATERGLAPVKPAGSATGVTRRVENANAHGVDAQGHTLDPHGKPVGQAPTPSTSVR
ncbi:hypothetical protein [Luteibacter sp. 9135]|uniref:hypothetical protein n=1 Tax=Luteibacter sp. 9135 TaxID=1500893 RepID=UPI00055A89FD|nr:hypothetical protein [Luteibacter sp. 9135]